MAKFRYPTESQPLAGKSAELVREAVRTGKALMNKQAKETFTRILLKKGKTQAEIDEYFADPDSTKFIWADKE